ncbi:hypothetical protein [Streptomyces sp. NPDC090026]|uniref:hypothetical protein n=1 Tax=Streptomyces sp. NPDC090026 TaxID=3365923 RepID=UPI003812706B
MNTRTLARRTGRTGWAHPYGHGPFSPFLYADGGDGDGSDSNAGGADDDSGDGGQDDDADGSDGGGQDDADDTAKDDKPKPKPPARKPADGDPAETIARLEKQLKAANAEAGKARTDAKRQAAEEAKASLVQELGKALGLVKDDDETPPDPAALKAQIESATAAHRETAIELAVYRGASKHGADPDALTDSRAFLRAIKDLDPTDDGFAKKVGDAIKKAVDTNPKLKAASQAPARSSGDFSGGSGGRPKDDSIEAHREARRKARGG